MVKDDLPFSITYDEWKKMKEEVRSEEPTHETAAAAFRHLSAYTKPGTKRLVNPMVLEMVILRNSSSQRYNGFNIFASVEDYDEVPTDDWIDSHLADDLPFIALRILKVHARARRHEIETDSQSKNIDGWGDW